jgi:hypothetical protein
MRALRGASWLVLLPCGVALLGIALAGSSRAGEGGPTSQAVVDARAGRVVPASPAEIERMCALLTTCDRVAIPPGLHPADFAGCVARMAEVLASPSGIGAPLAIRECARTATSCAELRSCALRGASDDACAGRGTRNLADVCDVDGRAITCWHEHAIAVRDCPRGGESCRVVGGEATCSLGACGADASAADPPRCSASGTHVVHCQGGALASVNCAAMGLTCVLGGDAGAACAPASPACSGSASRCEGGVSIGCYAGREVRVDCAVAGLSCGGTPADAVMGACSLGPSPGPACDRSAPARCEGGSIQYCAFGRSRSFSCKSAGFSGCEAARSGGISGARCVP